MIQSDHFSIKGITLFFIQINAFEYHSFDTPSHLDRFLPPELRAVEHPAHAVEGNVPRDAQLALDQLPHLDT